MVSSSVGDRRDSQPTITTYTEDEPKVPRNWRAWTCLAGCFFLMFNSWGNVNATGTYLSFYKQHILADSDALLQNLIGAVQCFFILTLSGLSGRLVDAGYSTWLIGIGSTLTFVGMLALAFVGGDVDGGGNYGLILLTQGIIAGIGMGCLFVPSSQICSTWFPQMKGLAICIVASGASISGLIYPIMLKELIVILGFREAVLCVCAVMGSTLLFSFIFARPNPTWPIRKPASWATAKAWVHREAFQNKSYVWFTASISMLFFGFYCVFFNLEEWAADHGLGKKDVVPGAFQNVDLDNEVPNDAIRVFYLLAIMNGTSTVGRMLAAFLSDRYGALNIHMAATFVGSILLLGYWTVIETTGATIGFVVVFGIFSGTVIALPPASTAYILERSKADSAYLGQWIGMMYAGAGIPSLIGPIIAGYLISRYDTYITVQVWSGICLFLSAVFMGISRYCLMGEAKKNLHSVTMTSTLTAQSSRTVLPSMLQTPKRSLDDGEKRDIEAANDEKSAS